MIDTAIFETAFWMLGGIIAAVFAAAVAVVACAAARQRRLARSAVIEAERHLAGRAGTQRDHV